MKYAYLAITFFGAAALFSACSDETTSGAGSSSSSSSSSSSGSQDAGEDASFQCGIGPGTPGNSKGVGKYCDAIADCSGQDASICAVLGDPTAHFCTRVCDPMMPVDTQCGEDASCSCDGGGPCGCTPLACSPDAGSPDAG